MFLTHENRVAVVTGAARGIGQAISHQLAERGATVVAVDREEPTKTLDLLGKAGRPGLGLQIDVSDPEQTQRVGDAVRERYGHCDILVNNAGIYPFIEIDDLTFDAWRNTLAINLDAQFLMVKALLPLMQGWGRIVNLTSNAIVTESTGLPHYIASKMGVIGFTRALSNELGARGITVNAVGPTLTRTPGSLAAGHHGLTSTPATAATTDDAYRQDIAERQAIKKIAEPDDVVGAILFLTSEDSYFVTGQTLMADGGLAKNI